MKTRPILFSGPMVRAILEGRKTQTRRVVKDSFKVNGFMDLEFDPLKCPYGQTGDRLWVRETWAPDPVIKPAAYKADWPYPVTTPHDGKWHPSIHMPRWASRITLEIIGVRVARVQDITEADARAEGIEPTTTNPGHFNWKMYGVTGAQCHALLSFKTLWDSINAKRGYGWEVNPWVWVVEFKRVQQ